MRETECVVDKEVKKDSLGKKKEAIILSGRFNILILPELFMSI